MVYYKISLKMLEYLLECEKRLKILQSFDLDNLDTNGNFTKVCKLEAKQELCKYDKIRKDSE